MPKLKTIALPPLPPLKPVPPGLLKAYLSLVGLFVDLAREKLARSRPIQ